MASAAIETMIRMMQALPEATQREVVEHLREYLEDMKDERRWDETFAKTQDKLAAAAQRARREMAERQARYRQ